MPWPVQLVRDTAGGCAQAKACRLSFLHVSLFLVPPIAQPWPSYSESQESRSSAARTRSESLVDPDFSYRLVASVSLGNFRSRFEGKARVIRVHDSPS